ncbi:3-deoxy-manno-octulosonate cytidylyltransferase [Alcaligenes ammonioxydans]|uniref:3-deoxy-manno-octulosonate cytidylyltransferase n=1 Tax=Alcaligenes ammonioxydans TaxID=2582914 RepID=A0ABX8SRT7_9BURK|nr:3-deoxy-manno-octulosonate cytidylyltransferase [Alcaligenes ammonioxydans]QXX78742.1 3-deoxy-manno-octulosonate cytidylyltransferase [Alcaligenes ammonioxydans]
MTFSVIIPARLGSTRLPNKPLADIAGQPMIVRCAQQAAQSAARQVWVATDSPQVLEAVQAHGFHALLTDAEHPTGTDRLAQAARLLDLAEDEIVVNVQGDEPLIQPEHINAAAQLLARSGQADIATLAAPITNAETLFNPNAVKVVCDLNDRALYFSRAPIPWARDTLAQGDRILADELPALHHIGLYAYRNRFLQQYAQLPRGPLEHFESLEQLRALENGFQIMVHRLQEIPAAGVDTEQDLERVRAHFANRL